MKKLTAIVLALLLCLSTLSVGAVGYTPDVNARYINLGEIEGYALLYDTKTFLADENYTRVIGDYYFTTYSEELGLSLSDGENAVPLESAYGALIGDSGIKSVAKAINQSKKNGIKPFDKWTVTNGSPNPREKFSTGSGKTYYLFGWIYGQNYACEENADDMGKFRFEHGQLLTTFEEEAYVGVKEENNAAWYMTDGWLGTDVTSAILYNTSITGANSNKLYVPAGVEICFTLVENGDGSLTLSYSTEVESDPSEPTMDSEPGGAIPPSDGGVDPSSTNVPTMAPTISPSVKPPSTDAHEEPTKPTLPSTTICPWDPPTTTEESDKPSSPPSPSTDPPENPTQNPTQNTPTEKPTVKPTAKPTTPPGAQTDSNFIKLNIIAATLQAGKVITLKATDKNGKKVSVTFSSSNKKVAKVTGKGKLYALKRGVAKITVKFKKNKMSSCIINVVTSPKLSKNKIKLKKGQTKSVKISGKSSAVKNTYKNTKIAKVTSARTAKKLKIRGLKRGTTTLKIKVNGVSLKLKVIVN